MNLTDYIRILLRRGWIIVIAILLTAGSAFIFSRVQTRVYRATQIILIKPARADFGLTQSLKQLMGSYVLRLDTDLRADEVIRVLKLEFLPAQLHDMVKVTPDLNNLSIVIDVDMTDGATAASVAQEYGQLFVQWRNQENQPQRLEDRITAEMLDAPTPGLIRPNTSVNVAAGALLGVLIGGVVVFVLEYLESNIMRRAEDVERFLELPVLGRLINED